MKRNILLTIKYDGTPFAGWQIQPKQRTVQGEVEKALSILCAMPIKISGTSRTDAGVHALGQRASFAGDFIIPTKNIKFALNNLLPKSIQIVDVEERLENFSARFDSKGKTYIYKIINSREQDPFLRDFYYYVKKPLNVNNMKNAAQYIKGTHDFECFQSSGGAKRATTVRTISELEISQKGAEINIKVTGNAFLYNMVRIITGTLVDVGTGKRKVEEIPEIINSKNRIKAGHTAPAQGLYLAEIYY